MISRRKSLPFILGTIIFVFIMVSGFFFWQFLQIKNTAVTDEATQQVITKISNLYTIPTDEKPAVAKVNDKEKVKKQPFFKNAENGDYVLMFTSAKFAILYREKDNKIINVGPIAITQ